MGVIHDASQKPWLKHGDLVTEDGKLLLFERTGECNHCGECCKGNVFQHLSPAQQREYEASDFNGGYCYQYDRKAQRCRIYDHRPHYCLMFPRTPDQMPAECSYEFKFTQIGIVVSKEVLSKELTTSQLTTEDSSHESTASPAIP